MKIIAKFVLSFIIYVLKLKNIQASRLKVSIARDRSEHVAKRSKADSSDSRNLQPDYAPK
jgi:hypothetical protein